MVALLNLRGRTDGPPSKLEAEVYALERKDLPPDPVTVRKSLDGTGWLRLHRVVANENTEKLVELLEEAEAAYLAALRAGEITHRSQRWSAWYVNHILGGRS